MAQDPALAPRADRPKGREREFRYRSLFFFLLIRLATIARVSTREVLFKG
jgi:hypothetical protein